MPSKQVTIQGVMTWEDSPTFPSQGPGFPTNPIAPGGQPPSIWNPVFPTNPIAPGGPPPGIWPSPGVPTPPIYYPPGVNIPTFPTHPIAPGGPPPGIWPSPGRPDQGLPGNQPGIDNSLPGNQPGIWNPVFPNNPISGGGVVVGWSPVYGWVYIPIGGGPPAPQPPPVDPNAPRPTHPIAGAPTPEPKE